MKTQARALIVAIKDKKEYIVPVEANGNLCFSGANFLALAKYNKDVLFELVKKNAENSLKIYQLGATLPALKELKSDITIDEKINIVLSNPIVKKFPQGRGDFFVEEKTGRKKDVFSPLGESLVSYSALLDYNKQVLDYDGIYNKYNSTVTKDNARTYIIDFDEKVLKIYGERIGAKRAVISFCELVRLNRDVITKHIISNLLVKNTNGTTTSKNEVLLSKIQTIHDNYSLTLNLLKASHINKENFTNAYIHSLKINNNIYTQAEVINKLGLLEETRKYIKDKLVS